MKRILLSLIILPGLLVNSLPLFAQQNALNFDGINDYVQTSYPGVSGSAARTVEAWIKTTANCDPNNGGVQKVICDWGAASPNGSRYTLNLLWSNSIRIEVAGSGLGATTPLNNGVWHHVAAVYDPGNSAGAHLLYIDGTLAIQGNIATTVNTLSSTAMRIGMRVDGANSFLGSIDEVRVWNVARTASQIAASFNHEICGPQSNLTAYYTFNQGSAGGTNTTNTTLYNKVSNQHGNLLGFALTGSGSNWVTGSPIPGSTGSTASIQACASYLSPTGKTYTASGVYYDTLMNATGCDSIIITQLSLMNSGVAMNVYGCGQYISPTGKIYTVSGTYYDTLTNAANCDSVITQYLTINQASAHTITQTVCIRYISPTGKIYTTSGVYIDTLTNAANCDSILTQNITVKQVNIIVTQVGVTLTSQASGATYKWLNCNNNFSAIPGATTASYTPAQNGSYAVAVTQNGCTDTSLCFIINSVSIDESIVDQSFLLFPNPANGCFTVQFSRVMPVCTIQIFDLSSRKVFSKDFSEAESIVVDPALAPGIYWVQCSMEGSTITKKLLIN